MKTKLSKNGDIEKGNHRQHAKLLDGFEEKWGPGPIDAVIDLMGENDDIEWNTIEELFYPDSDGGNRTDRAYFFIVVPSISMPKVAGHTNLMSDVLVWNKDTEEFEHTEE